MNKIRLLAFLSSVLMIFFICSSVMALPGSEFKNNMSQSAQGLKLTFDVSITINGIKGDISPFTQKTAWGPGNGIWLSGGTLTAGATTGCMYFSGRTVTSAAWTSSDINTVLGNALNGEQACEAKIPTLTQWGMIILIALIIVAGVYLWMRRKPVTA